MLVTPRKGTACLTLAFVADSMVMIHPIRITANRNLNCNCHEIVEAFIGYLG